MNIKVARYEPVQTVTKYSEEVLFVCPVEDVQVLALNVADLVVYKIRNIFRRVGSVDGFSRPAPLKDQIRSFLNVYSSDRKRVFDPHFKNFLRDPVVSILWWFRFSAWVRRLQAAGEVNFDNCKAGDERYRVCE